LRPLLFNIATNNVIKTTRTNNRRIKIYAYADDMVMVSALIQELQKSFNDLVQWAEDNRLQITLGGSEMMVYREGRECEA
jgi:effector-binding domain-containing protein